jgi:hypothetical protein
MQGRFVIETVVIFTNHNGLELNHLGFSGMNVIYQGLIRVARGFVPVPRLAQES